MCISRPNISYELGCIFFVACWALVSLCWWLSWGMRYTTKVPNMLLQHKGPSILRKSLPLVSREDGRGFAVLLLYFVTPLAPVSSREQNNHIQSLQESPWKLPGCHGYCRLLRIQDFSSSQYASFHWQLSSFGLMAILPSVMANF